MFSLFNRHACPTQLRFAVTHTDPSCAQKPHGHAACGCHGNQNPQRLPRRLCFIARLQGIAEHTWAFWNEELYSPSVLSEWILFFFGGGGKLLRTRLLCEPSWESICFTDREAAVITSQSCSNKYICGKSRQLPKAAARRAALVLCKLGALSRYTQTFASACQ